MEFKDKEQITLNGHVYEYDEFYKRLTIMGDNPPLLGGIFNASIVPHVKCPKCLGNHFQLQYGNYEINAICSCGHSMTVYDG